MTLQVSVGEVVQFQFPVFDVDGITPVSGLADVDFSKLLLDDNSVSGVSMTITEVGATGRYVCTFTPTSDGLWYAEVTTPYDDVFGEQVQVGPPPDDWLDAIWGTDLPGSFPADTAGARLANVDDAVQSLETALVMARLTVTGGSTATDVATSSSKADGFYDDLVVAVIGASGAVVRSVEAYKNVGGVFTVEALPFVPIAGDSLIVLGDLGAFAVADDSTVALRLLEIHQRLGLDEENPLYITRTSHTSGDWKLTQTAVGDQITVQREDV